MQIPTIITADNIFTFLRPSGRNISLSVGDVVRAEVVSILESGALALSITPGKGQGGLVIARTEVPLDKGDSVVLKVIGGEREMRLRLIGTAGEGAVNRPEKAQGDVHEALLGMLSDLSRFRASGSDLKHLFAFFRSLPESLKSFHPDFSRMEELLPEIGRLNAQFLQSSTEGSGVLFETRLGKAAREIMEQGKSGRLGALFGEEPDMKGIALRLRDLLQDERFAERLLSSGVKPQDFEEAVDKIMKNIEFFQVSSRINDMFYTYLPVSWQQLREGELSFRRRKEEEGESYTCDLNLDMEAAGKVSASVTLFGRALYVTMYAENPATTALLLAEKAGLQERFSSAGLDLRALNVGHMREIRMGDLRPPGLNVKA